MQNKANFRNDKMSLTIDMTNNYKISSLWRGQKTKPIQTQFKPIKANFNAKQSQFKPKQTQFKPNFTIPQTLKNEQEKKASGTFSVPYLAERLYYLLKSRFSMKYDES
jgi:hypothetical protein